MEVLECTERRATEGTYEERLRELQLFGVEKTGVLIALYSHLKRLQRGGCQSLFSGDK